jgi:O-acetyl-ADP-ribose deacetylase (regulator of RNase III)
MIEYSTGNLLTADAEALVNTVNTEGIMGKGIALQFKSAYPRVFKAYADACKNGRVQLGQMDIHDLGGLADGPRWIINFPTKGHWKARSRIADIESGLISLVATVKDLGIQSIAVPPLGCGNGGLNWSDVQPLIERAFSKTPETKVLLFAPSAAPAAIDMPNRTEKPKLTQGQATLIALMQRYLDGLLDPFITLLELHKLMYFMQEAGENLRLTYVPHHYGPYAQNLRQVLIRMEGHYLRGYGDGEDAPDKPVEVINESGKEAERFLAQNYETLARMKRVSELIDGYEDSYGLELLSTVHWVMCHRPNARDSLAATIEGVSTWSDRKKHEISPEQMEKAWLRLKEMRWDSESRSAPRYTSG